MKIIAFVRNTGKLSPRTFGGLEKFGRHIPCSTDWSSAVENSSFKAANIWFQRLILCTIGDGV